MSRLAEESQLKPEKDSSLLVVRQTVTLRDLALKRMREAILTFHFLPGERLVERRLCELLGVSRTVVREVLRHLETEGLVQMVLHHGPIVARLNPDEIEQIYELRASLEAIAGRACAEKATDADIVRLEESLARITEAFAEENVPQVLEKTTEFYETLFLSSGKTVAWEIISNLNARINALRVFTVSSLGRSETGPLEMRKIVDAIRARNPAAAEAACELHVRHACEIARQRTGEVGTEAARAFKPGQFSS